jgi:hypothetical protein
LCGSPCLRVLSPFANGGYLVALVERRLEEANLQIQSRPSQRRFESRAAVLSLTGVLLAGCGGSAGVQEIPEAAKKTLVKRKVDFEPRSTKSSKTGEGSMEGQAPPR